MNQTILEDMFLQAAVDLFLSNGIRAYLVPEGSAGAELDAKPCYVSVLGADGEGISISSMMKIERDVLISLHPLGRAEIPNADLEDWSRELNNQLVGRLKNKLLRYGVTIKLSLPIILRGTDVHAVASPDAAVLKQAIRTPHGNISLTLATIVDEGLDFNERESLGDEEVLLEGAVSFF